ncbi:DUF502 domain-containing protein [Halomarina halobia]|uniref:DUF502 domain-containing protein n=1 Tax=Halomarina halobia TaxID=3033386 RepID=A0ABD6A602_9EURY|nr:DUF502 domain-containing protein [Halomarina sp. PSR21]
MPLGDRNVGRPRTDRTLRGAVRQWFITGAALTIPLFATLLVFVFALDFLSGLLDPVVAFLGYVPETEAENVQPLVLKVSTVLAFVAVVFLVGIVAETHPTGGRLTGAIDRGIERIPGVGSLYTGFRQMSEVVVESDVESFRDVKLVEFPTEGSYTLAFVTAETPAHIEETAGYDDMVTLFMPMAPNPVMGGYVLHVSRARVIDVDMTVEEGVQSIVTSGVTVNGEADSRAIPPERLRSLGMDDPAGNPADGDGDAARTLDGE